MWARVASFENIDVEQLRKMAGQRPPDDLIPSGLKGILNFIDADGKRQVFITFFESREEIEAAEPSFERRGDNFPEEMRGRRVSVDYYEVPMGIVSLAGEMR
jgi:hypothetical protein